MSLSPEKSDAVEPTVFAKPSLSRRTVLQRAAAVSLVALPAAGLLDAGATGGGGGSTPAAPRGAKSAGNPPGGAPKAPPQVIIFNRGFGEKYATERHLPPDKEALPRPAGQGA